jgi:tetratricopeptide (TPR) repeat protein
MSVGTLNASERTQNGISGVDEFIANLPSSTMNQIILSSRTRCANRCLEPGSFARLVNLLQSVSLTTSPRIHAAVIIILQLCTRTVTTSPSISQLSPIVFAHWMLPSNSSRSESHTAHTSSVPRTVAQNISEDAGRSTAALTSIMDGKDDELIEACRAVTLLSIDHPDWLDKCTSFAHLLRNRCQENSDPALLVMWVDIQRQICGVCTLGHPNRAKSVSNLALSIRGLFAQTGDQSLVDEAIELYKEALSLQPDDYPDPEACHGLAIALVMRFMNTGEASILIEAKDLLRRAMSLQPRGHPEFSKIRHDLGNVLARCFNITGEESLLAESIDLHREVLSLRPRGDSFRDLSCSSLAISLWHRFNQTGEEFLLAEIIDLQREALSLCPPQHPQRSLSCNNLATSLTTLYKETAEGSLLVEIITLRREALSLRPSGHIYHSTSCCNLAEALEMQFERTGEESLFIEAVDLHKEALSLQPYGHPERYYTCILLGALLWTRFNKGGDESLIFDAIDINQEAIRSQPPHHPTRWKPITNLIRIYLDRRFSQHNVAYAIEYLRQVTSLTSSEWPTFLSEVAELSSLIDLPSLPPGPLHQLLEFFSAAVDISSRVAGFILDSESQMRYLGGSRHLGPRAYWCAIACGQPQLGLELMERSRAMIWSQALHMRSPQLSGAPSELASELEFLLNSINTSRVLRTSASSRQFSSTGQDIRHKSSVRIYEIIQQIRAMPGHERFMSGLSFEELSQCASRNAVVVLVATEGECHALILRPHKPEPVILRLSSITPDELTTMSLLESSALWRGSSPHVGVHDRRIGMRVPSRSQSDQVLGKLWTTVVKPVLDLIQITVCTIDASISTMSLTDIRTEILGIIATTPLLVPYRCLYVPASTCCGYIRR